MSRPARYHPILVVIHWISSILIIFTLLMGMFWLKLMPNTPSKIPFLAVHMTIGIVILLLTSVRLLVRFSIKLPPAASTGNRFLDLIGNITHILLYMGMLSMGLSGLGIASQAGLMDIVFGGSGASLPISLYAFPACAGHGIIALVLLALVGLHVAGTLYHQAIRKDGLLKRMTLQKGV